MRLCYRAGICTLALIAGSAVMLFEPAILRDLAIDKDGRRIAVGAVRVPLWSAAFAQSADSFSLENVSFTFGSASFEAKSIALSGVTSSRAEIEALFSSSSTEPMESRLKRINAKQVVIPEARVTQTIGTDTQTSTYKNTVLKDISAGRIASSLIETSATQTTGAKGTVLISAGRASMDDLDLPAMARLYETKADGATPALVRIYGAFTVDNVEFTDNETATTFKIARLGGRDFMARPTKDSWSGTTAIFTDMANRKDLSPEEQGRLFPAVADLLDAFQIGFMEATGIETTSKSGETPGQARIARIAYTGAADGRPADMRWEGFTFSDKDNSMKLDSMSFTGFSFRQTIDGLRSLQGKPLDNLDPATMRSLVPTLGTLRFSGFSLDGTTDKDGRKEKVQAAFKGFELTAEKPINAIPTHVRIGVENFTMALPAASSDDGIKELVALGYKTIDVSLLADATWNEAANEIALSEVSFQGQDMGSISVTGIVGNVGKDLFDADTAIATVALAGARAKALDVTVENKGLFERYLDKAAKEQKTKPESLRRAYAAGAAFVVPAMIGSSEQARALSQAIARFIAKPGRLMINATPKDPSGFGIVEAVLLQDPKAILDKLNVSAKAE